MLYKAEPNPKKYLFGGPCSRKTLCYRSDPNWHERKETIGRARSKGCADVCAALIFLLYPLLPLINNKTVFQLAHYLTILPNG